MSELLSMNSADGGNGADGDGAQGAHPVRGRSHEPKLLVRDVNGASRRLHHRISQETRRVGALCRASLLSVPQNWIS